MKQKTIWMRYLIIGVISCCFTTFSSCKTTEEGVKTISYVYKNQTNVDLVMEIYNSDKELFKSFEILKNKQIETNTTQAEGGPALFYFASIDKKIGDSIVIKFQDSKCLYYSKNIQNRIFEAEQYDNYTASLNSQNTYTLFFSFTNEDYFKAEDCDN